MKKELKTALIILTVVFIGAIIFLFVWELLIHDDKKPSIEEGIVILNETYPTDIIVYGDSFEKYEGFKCRTIDKISKDNLKSEDKYVFSVLVINDANGNVEISDDEWGIIREAILNGLNYYYVGTKYINTLNDVATTKIVDIEDGGLASKAYVHTPTSIDPVTGIFRKEDLDDYNSGKLPLIICERLIYSIRTDVINTYNKLTNS